MTSKQTHFFLKKYQIFVKVFKITKTLAGLEKYINVTEFICFCYSVLIVLARSTGLRRTYFENNAVKPAAGARPLASLTHPKF